MGSSLDELKSRLRSLVVSSPAQVDTCGLARDYRLMMGEHLPASRYGYRDIVSFLREKCSDCFLTSIMMNSPLANSIREELLQKEDSGEENVEEVDDNEVHSIHESETEQKAGSSSRSRPSICFSMCCMYVIGRKKKNENRVPIVPQ